MKKILPIILILAAIGAGIYYVLNQGEKEITLTGIVTTDEVIVSAQISGRLIKADSRPQPNQGDAVKAGDLLAEIDPAQFQADSAFYENSQKQAATQVAESAAELRYEELQSQNQILQAQANLAAAEAQVVEATSDLENLRLTFERTDDLHTKGVESAQAFDQARTAYDAGKAHLLSLNKTVLASQAALEMSKSTAQQIEMRKAALEMSRHQLAAAGAQRDKANITLGYTKIVAPVGGIIDQRTALVGEVVNPGQAIYTIIDRSNLWVRADVEETYIDRVHLGDTMQIRLPSGAALTGTVFYIAKDADFATQRDVSRTKRDIKTFEVRLHCDPKDLSVGMTAYITLPLTK